MSQKKKVVNAEVTVEDNNVDRALKKLRKKMKKVGVIEEVRKRQYFEKPSVERHRIKQRMARKKKLLKRHPELAIEKTSNTNNIEE